MTLLRLGAVAAIAALALTAGCSDSDDGPEAGASGSQTPLRINSVTELSAGPAVQAKCAAPTAADALRQTLAFEGKVTEVRDGKAFLEPAHFFTGRATDLVSIEQPDQGMSESAEEFVVGKDYIVGARDGKVSGCLLSGPANEDLRALYEAAFGG